MLTLNQQMNQLGEVKMRLEFVVVIGIVMIMHSIYVAGTIANSYEKTDRSFK